MSSFEEQPSPHTPLPDAGDPRFGWIIAILPVAHVLVQELALLTIGHASLIALILTTLGVIAASIALAQKDERALRVLGYPLVASPWLAILPAAYLLVRSFHRATYVAHAWTPFGVHLAVSVGLLLAAQWAGGFLFLLDMQTQDYSN